MARIDLKQCTIQIKDGTSPTPNILSIKVGSGDIQWTEKKNFIYVKDRGLLSTVRKGDQEPLDVKFSVIYEFLENTVGVSPEDFLKARGNASAYKTAGADPCQPYAVEMVFTQNQNCPGTPDQEILYINEFRYETIAHDLRNGMLSVAGKCNIERPTIVRS